MLTRDATCQVQSSCHQGTSPGLWTPSSHTENKHSIFTQKSELMGEKHHMSSCDLASAVLSFFLSFFLSPFLSFFLSCLPFLSFPFHFPFLFPLLSFSSLPHAIPTAKPAPSSLHNGAQRQHSHPTNHPEKAFQAPEHQRWKTPTAPL